MLLVNFKKSLFARSVLKRAVLRLQVIYLSYFGLWGAVALRPYLRGDLSSGGGGHGDASIVADIVWPSAIVTQLGIIIASVSQALQCLVTAPRLIQVRTSTFCISRRKMHRM